MMLSEKGALCTLLNTLQYMCVHAHNLQQPLQELIAACRDTYTHMHHHTTFFVQCLHLHHQHHPQHVLTTCENVNTHGTTRL